MPDLGPGFIFILGSNFAFGSSIADQMTPSEPRRRVSLTCVCVYSRSLSLSVCLSCAGSALCVSSVYPRVVGKVGRLLISQKNKWYLQAPLKPSVARVHVYLLSRPLGRRFPPQQCRTPAPSGDLWHGSPKCSAPMAPSRPEPWRASSLPLPATFESITVRYQRGPSWGSRQKWHFQHASTYPSPKRSRPRKIGLMAWLPA